MVSAHHPFIEPAHNMIEAFYAMPGLTRAREFVRLPWKDNHGGWAFHVLERAEQLFATRVLRSAEVGLSQHEQDGSVDVLYKGNGRAVVVVLRIFERGRFKPTRLEKGEIGRVPPLGPVGNIALRNSRREAVAVGDGPVGEDAAAATAGHA